MPPQQLQATMFNNNCTYLHVMSRCLLVVALHYTAAQQREEPLQMQYVPETG